MLSWDNSSVYLIKIGVIVTNNYKSVKFDSILNQSASIQVQL